MKVKVSVVSNSLWPHGLYSLWNSPGQNTGVGSLTLLQGIFPAQGLNPSLLRCSQILYQLSHKGSPRILEWVAYPFFRGSSRPRNWTRSPALQANSSPTELWQYTALTYSFPKFEPVCYSISGCNYCFLTCIQVSQETGKIVWYSHLLKNFPQFLWSTHSKALA